MTLLSRYFRWSLLFTSYEIHNNNNNNIENNYNNSLVIPYFSKFNSLPKILRPLGINVIFRFRNRLKDILIKNSPRNDVNIIYKIPCLDCNGMYVGQTSKTLETRIKQHRSYVKNYNNNSAIFKHAFDNDHRINWEESCKIINSNNWLDRNIIESFLIDHNKNTFNISKSLCFSDPILTNLLTIDLKKIIELMDKPS